MPVNAYVGSATIPTGGVDGTITSNAEWTAAAVTGNSGKTYYVRAGTYTAKSFTSVTPAADITFLGYPGEENSIVVPSLTLTSCTHLKFSGMKINGLTMSGTTANCTVDNFKCFGGIAVINNQCSNILLDRFSIDAQGGASCILLDGGSGPSNTTVADSITIKRGIIKNPLQDGLRIQQGTNILCDTVEFTAVCDNVWGTDTHSDCVSITGSLGKVDGVSIQNCYFHDNDGQGVYADDFATANLTINNTLFVRQEGAGLDVGNGVCIVFMAVNTVTVTNCTAFTGGSIGFSPRMNDSTGPNSNITWHHNVFQNPFDDGGGLQAATLARHHNIICNDVFAGTITANTGGGTNEVAVAPASMTFTNTATDDYRTSTTAGGQAVGITSNVAALARGPLF